MQLEDERTYRNRVDDVLRRIDAAFEAVDPDEAESSIEQGALTILFPRLNLRAIVSAQPPVRQIWLAFRSRGWHFDWDAAAGRWVDDKGEGKELFSLIEEITRDVTGIPLQVDRGG